MKNVTLHLSARTFFTDHLTKKHYKELLLFLVLDNDQLWTGPGCSQSGQQKQSVHSQLHCAVYNVHSNPASQPATVSLAKKGGMGGGGSVMRTKSVRLQGARPANKL